MAQVTTIAFEAFECYDFGKEGRVLVSDVGLDCDGEDYSRVQAEAYVSGLIYPVGLRAPHTQCCTAFTAHC